jgi:[ribosomal protein S18]-alanine N-acetyltransferase
VALPRPEASPYRLRPAALTDLDEIVAIEQASFLVPWRREFFEAELYEPHRYHRVLEAVEAGMPRVAGFLFAVSLYEEFHVNKIATHPDCRRQGYGRRLMEDGLARARARRAASVTLEVRVSNTAARRFYASYGFVDSHRRRAYYQDGEDAVVMVLPLLTGGK